MPLFPVNLDVQEKKAVVIGGGRVALRKCRSLLEAQAEVTVIAPEQEEELRLLADAGKLQIIPRPYQRGDLAGAFIAFAASSDPQANREAAIEARERGVLLCVADNPALGNFTSPSRIRRGDLLITVSTSGAAPAFSRAIRKELEERFGPEYAEALRIFRAVREKLLTERKDADYNTTLMCALAESDLPDRLRSRSREETDSLLLNLLGPGFTLAELGAAEKEEP